MGTVVKIIRRVEGNNEQIEGKMEGQTMLILQNMGGNNGSKNAAS